MGATIYVDASATGGGAGADWANAYTTISAALNAPPQAGDEIWVAAGTYAGGISLVNQVALYGGFAGYETNRSQRAPRANLTYINGGVQAIKSIDDDATTILSGFVITGGSTAPVTSTGSDTYGGGMYLENSSARIDQCVFTANTSQSLGAAVAVCGGSPSFENCIFHGNTATWSGGAAYIRDEGTPTFLNSLFYDNQAMEGGAIASAGAGTTFINCTFAKNKALEPQNSVSGRGGAIWDGGGLVVLRNCIIWDNEVNEAGTESIYNIPSSGTTTATYSNIELTSGVWPGTANINADPLFLNSDPAVGNYQLRYGSPSIDVGDPSDDGAGQTDIDGDARVSNTVIDMGSGEFTDCNSNNVVDLCDLSCSGGGGNCGPTGCGTSADCGSNGIPDESESCSVADAPTNEPNGVKKNRYVSFVPGNLGRHVALRVTIQSLPSPFQSFNGTKMWVAAPVDTCENGAFTTPPCSGPSDTFWAARLSCDPVYLDWSSYGTVHVYDDEVLPGGTYAVQAIDCLCDTGTETDFSASLQLRTVGVWGDVTGGYVGGAWTAPDGIADIADVTAVQERYMNYSTAPTKARTDIDPDVPNRLVNISDLFTALDASNGTPYPYNGPTSCGGGGGGGPE